MRIEQGGYCPRCGKDTPYVKAYPSINGRAGRYKVWVCMLCHERVHVGRWRARPARDDLGKMRQSSGEAAYGIYLAQMERAGVIQNLRRCNDHPRRTFTLEFYGTQAVTALLAEIESVWGQTRSWETVATIPLGVKNAVRDVRRSLTKVAHYTPDYSFDQANRERIVDVKGKSRADLAFSKIQTMMRIAHNIEVEIAVPTGAMRETLRTLEQARPATHGYDVGALRQVGRQMAAEDRKLHR